MSQYRIAWRPKSGTDPDGFEWEEYFLLFPRMSLQLRHFIAYIMMLAIVYFGIRFVVSIL